MHARDVPHCRVAIRICRPLHRSLGKEAFSSLVSAAAVGAAGETFAMLVTRAAVAEVAPVVG